MTTVLVTGASSGIGLATAARLGRHSTVFAGVRDREGADAVSRAAAGGDVTPVCLDVTSPSDIAGVIAQIEAESPAGLDALVNVAGIGVPGPLELVKLDDLRRQLEVNVVGQVAVTQAALPLLRRREGRLVFVGSIGGRVALPFAAPYHASKFAMEAVGECWRQELQPQGIKVSLIEPGPVSTAIWPKAVDDVDELLIRDDPTVDLYRDELESFRESLESADRNGADPDSVARVIERVLADSNPAVRYPVGLGARLGAFARPLIPDRLFDLLARKGVAG